jgi:membrane-bound serine protease (ClpP class)
MHARAHQVPRRFRTLPIFCICAFLLLSGTSAAQEGDGRFVTVVQVSGWLDPIVVDFVTGAVADAQRDQPEVLILQVDSPGALTDIDGLVDAISASEVPVAAWIGDSGAKASDEAGRIVEAADIVAMANRTELELDGRTYDDEEAQEAGIAQLAGDEAPVLQQLIAALDDDLLEGSGLDTADVTAPEDGDGPPEARLNVQARLAKLDLWPRLMHTFASPPVAYLLLAAGLVLLVFELFTGGVGVAGGVGAVALVLSSYGLTVLPTNPVGVALIVFGVFGFAVDVQTGVPRLWTGIGTASFAAGSVLLYGDGIRLSWLTLLAGVVGVLLLVLAGLPATVRSRFSTPTIGRESMIGEVGEAVQAVTPDGVVRVRGALWPAHTSRQTPLEVGAPVRVVAIDGPVLAVEPVDADT